MSCDKPPPIWSDDKQVRNYDWKTECVISAGGLSGILNVLLATLEPGEEVLMTDPIYVGLINRVRLAGGIPHFVPLMPSGQGWRLDIDALANIDSKPIKAALLMSPSMPTGAVFNREEWQALIDFCQRANCWLINDSAMERILYDGRDVIHPASFQGMREKVITVGAASKEYRMIGWRVGWWLDPLALSLMSQGSALRMWCVRQELLWARLQQPSMTPVTVFKPV